MSRRSLVAAVLALPLSLGAQTPARDSAPPQTTGTATIRGRVVDVATGRPLRGMTISVTPIGRDRSYHGTATDGDGRYEVTGIPAGRYAVTASGDGYLRLSNGQTRPNQGATPIVLADRQILERVDFHLPRGGVIAGVLRDENNDPIPNQQVRILNPTYTEGRRTLALVGDISLTNDLGEFRIYGLPPGAFYVAAVTPAMASDAESAGSAYAPTYYPGTTNLSEAQRLVVKLGEVAGNADFSLRATRFGSISGTVLDPDGRPLTMMQLSVKLGTTGVAPVLAIPRVADNGQFTLRNMPPGDYEVVVTGTSAPPERQPMIATGAASLSNGEAVTGLRLVATRMASGSGRVVVEPSLAGSLGPLSLQVIDVSEAVPYQPRTAGPIPLARVQPDMSFTVTSSFRRATLAFSTLPVGWFLKAIRVNAVDVSDTGISFPEGGNVSGIEVELTNKPSQVSGTVRGANNESTADYTVVVFAQDPVRRRGFTRYFATARPEAGGRFLISGLPSGDYFAIAVEWADPVASADPDLLEPFARDATPFALVDGEAKSLDLRLVK